MAQKKKRSLNTEALSRLIRENYLSIILGLFISLLIVFGFIKFITGYEKPSNIANTGAQIHITKETITNGSMQNVTEKNNQTSLTLPTSTQTYTVQDGDSLWTVAEKYFKSGYNAYDIAVANNISDPNIISAGDKLVIPHVASKEQTVFETKEQITAISTSQVTITTNTYTVQNGDSLWSVATGAYGDGNMWVRLARDNNIVNPSLIYAGTVLSISRN